jgi:hypothetical protein
VQKQRLLDHYPVRLLLYMLAVIPSALGCRPASAPDQPTALPQPIPLVSPAADPADQPTIQPTAMPPAAETAVTTIPLAGDISRRSAEISGLAWYGDWLILLPQYPTFSSGGEDGLIFALPRADILAFLDGTKSGPLEPIDIPVIAPGLEQDIPGYEGFEAITFDGDRAYLTLEARPITGMTGHLVSAEMVPDLSTLTIDVGQITAVESASGLANKSDETILLAADKLLTIHEANGIEVNNVPVAQRFTRDLQPSGTLPFPPVEYRITDATALDQDGRFWAINYFYPGEPELRPMVDPLATTYGQGATHAQQDGVERLLEFQFSESGISLLDQPPIQLELLPDDLRNWEGIARLDDRGFLLVTDKFPQTILGFIPYP